MTTTEIILALVGIAIGAWLGPLLADAITRACYFIEDLAHDICDKIRDRRK